MLSVFPAEYYANIMFYYRCEDFCRLPMGDSSSKDGQKANQVAAHVRKQIVSTFLDDENGNPPVPVYTLSLCS